MNKVKLPKKVCEAIDRTKACVNKGCEYDLVWVMNNTDIEDAMKIREFLKSPDGHERYFKALVNGYEPIEEDITVTITADQKKEIFDLHSRFVKTVSSHDLYRGLIVGEVIEDVLTIMNIQIEGVNK
jgi:hypothetical protein